MSACARLVLGIEGCKLLLQLTGTAVHVVGFTSVIRAKPFGGITMAVNRLNKRQIKIPDHLCCVFVQVILLQFVSMNLNAT